MNRQTALVFVRASGNLIEQARLHALLTQERPTSLFLERAPRLPSNVFCKKDAPHTSLQLSLADDLRLINKVGKTIMAIDKIP